MLFSYYLKLSGKVVLWHLIAQLVCLVMGVLAFGLLSVNYRWIEIFSSVFLSCGYVAYMYSKLYKVGERDTKSYVKEKPYACKGMVLCVLLLAIGLLLAVLYDASFTATSLLSKFTAYFPFRIWGYSFNAFMQAADGSVSLLYWGLYFIVPLFSCAFGYFSGMHRWEIGYIFFKNLVFKKKEK